MAVRTRGRQTGLAGDEFRRDEVVHLLAAVGPAPSPRPLETASGESPVLRLAAILPALGPLFCAFGRYLSSRLDLLSEADCRALAAVPDTRPPMSPEALRDLLRRELGPQPSPQPAFDAFDPLPVASTLIYQEHRALVDRMPVVVRLVRPELELEMARDLDLLSLLGPALAAGSAEPRWLPAAVDDFAQALAAGADLTRQAAALAALAQDGAASGLLVAAPRIVQPSTAGLLIAEELPGASLPPPASPAGHRADEAGRRPGAEELAVRLCRTWLRQACFGQVFPVDFKGGDVRALPDGRIAWTGGTFAALPPAARSDLWEYLLAAAAEDPDRAGAALLRELEGGPAAGSGPLRQHLRQLVPFRDGGWEARDDLAGYLFLHWRCAAQEGYRPRPGLIAFYRGLARLAAEARRLSPERDALREGLDAARLTDAMREVLRLVDGDRLQEALGSYAAALLTLPRRVDELLDLAAEGRVSVKLEVVEPAADRRQGDFAAASRVVLMAMAAVVLLAYRLASSSVLGPWTERVAAVLLGALGTFLFLTWRRGT